MSLPPPSSMIRRDWTLPIIAGAVVVSLLVLALCVAGGVTAYLSLRREAAPTTPPPPVPSAAPTQPDPRSGQDCLIGDWLQTNRTETTQLFGATVQISGKGTIVRYAADGTSGWLSENVVLSGTAGGNNYEVIFNSTGKLNYIADADRIQYSNPSVTGTTTWKVNGRVRASEPTSSRLLPETYKCQGNQLRIFWDGGASEYQRIVPPGTPV